MLSTLFGGPFQAAETYVSFHHGANGIFKKISGAGIVYVLDIVGQ
jgi:hypothetical protein